MRRRLLEEREKRENESEIERVNKKGVFVFALMSFFVFVSFE